MSTTDERRLCARILREATARLEDPSVPIATALDDFRAFAGGLVFYLDNIASDAFESEAPGETAA